MRFQHAFAIVLLFLPACSRSDKPTAALAAGAGNPPAPPPAAASAAQLPGSNVTSKAITGAGPTTAAKIKPLTKEELRQLLDTRLNDTLCQMMRQHAQQPLSQFSNMFLAFSSMTIGRGIGLVTPSQEVWKSPVKSPFPASYRPKLRELLDSLAWQTFSRWKYDPTSRYFESDVEGQGTVDNLAMFEFIRAKREHPFEIDLAQGWTANDKGDWVMYVPPNFIAGMDIYQMGTYSADDSASENFGDQIRHDVSLEWLGRLGLKDEPDYFQTKKVGAYEALFFDKVLTGRDGKRLHWRQWVFLVGDDCYAVISTIYAELDDAIYADIEKMLPTFRIKGTTDNSDGSGAVDLPMNQSRHSL